MEVEQLVHGELPNIMTNREEEGKCKNERKWKGGEGKRPILLLFFQFLCFMRCPWEISLL